MKRALVLLVIACAPVQSPAPQDLAAKTLVVRDSGQTPFGVCGGVWAGPHEIVTAAHCAGPHIYATDALGSTVTGVEAWRDTERDLAGFDTELEAPAWAHRRWPDRFERLTIVLRDGAKTIGWPAMVLKRAPDWGQVELDGRLAPGDSGSPAFHADGSLACVVTAIALERDTTICAVPPSK